MRKEQLEKKREVSKKERTEQKEEKKTERQALACENITQKVSERQGSFNEQKEALRAKKTERVEDRQAERTKRDQEFSEKRVTAKERREQMYQNLLNKAETPEQKEAVGVFQSSVENAVSKRQQAIDNALKTFRNGIDALHANKKDTRAETLTTFQNAVSVALTQAKADCANGVSSQEVHEAYKKSLKEARATLKEARPDQGLGTQVKALAETKNTSIRQAISDYRTTLEEARQALKTAFASGESTSSDDVDTQ